MGDYVGEGRYEVHIGEDRCIWYEINLRHLINYRIYHDHNLYNRRRISKFLTTLVILGVEV